MLWFTFVIDFAENLKKNEKRNIGNVLGNSFFYQMKCLDENI